MTQFGSLQRVPKPKTLPSFGTKPRPQNPKSKGMVESKTRSISDNHHQMAYQSPFFSQSDDHLASLLPQQFHGHFLMKRSMSFDQKSCDQDQNLNGDDDLSDDGSHLGEKKKRLNMEQVRTLEKSFEIANKLDPDRKLQLAKALGLQQRQVAIWFQNRRARSKTKQLERDYGLLKKQFDAVKADNDTLQSHNKKLLAQLLQLKTRDSNETYGIDPKKETEQGSWSNGSDNSSDINLDISTTPAMNLCNMFGAMEDQPGMWTWPEHQHFQ